MLQSCIDIYSVIQYCNQHLNIKSIVHSESSHQTTGLRDCLKGWRCLLLNLWLLSLVRMLSLLSIVDQKMSGTQLLSCQAIEHKLLENSQSYYDNRKRPGRAHQIIQSTGAEYIMFLNILTRGSRNSSYTMKLPVSWARWITNRI